MLDAGERQRAASAFGVDDHQVRRDHLISHLLAAISSEAADDVVFFGGTALARTVLPDGRLSEDIDLIAVDRPRDVAARLTAALPRALRREFPGLRWEPPLTEVREPTSAILRSQDGIVVRVQLLSGTGYPSWPTRSVQLVQRYSDAGTARLVVPTTPAFVAAKAVAWHHRRASRDLWDLWALAEGGYLNREAASLYARLGPTNHPPAPGDYAPPPDQVRWERELSAQVRLSVTAAEAANTVADAWRRSAQATW